MNLLDKTMLAVFERGKYMHKPTSSLSFVCIKWVSMDLQIYVFGDCLRYSAYVPIGFNLLCTF